MSMYEDIIQGLNEAIEYKKGNTECRTMTVSIAPVPEISSTEIKEIRNTLEMTQSVFAAVMGVSVKTIEAWESGTNIPSGIARRMLSMLKTDPQLPMKYNLISR